MSGALARHLFQQPRLETSVRAGERHEAPVARRGQGDGHGVALVRPPHIDHTNALAAQVSSRLRAESADDRPADTEPRSRSRRDDGPAAESRQILRAVELLAQFWQTRQSGEDQILKRLTDDEQVDARHAKV